MAEKEESLTLVPWAILLDYISFGTGTGVFWRVVINLWGWAGRGIHILHSPHLLHTSFYLFRKKSLFKMGLPVPATWTSLVLDAEDMSPCL